MTLRKQFLVCAFVLICSFPLFSQPTRIGGSDTLIYLGQRFAEQYRAKHPGAQFTVRGGGNAASNAAEFDIVQVEGSRAIGKRVAFPIGIHGDRHLREQDESGSRAFAGAGTQHFSWPDHQLEGAGRP